MPKWLKIVLIAIGLLLVVLAISSKNFREGAREGMNASSELSK